MKITRRSQSLVFPEDSKEIFFSLLVIALRKTESFHTMAYSTEATPCNIEGLAFS